MARMRVSKTRHEGSNPSTPAMRPMAVGVFEISDQTWTKVLESKSLTHKTEVELQAHHERE